MNFIDDGYIFMLKYNNCYIYDSTGLIHDEEGYVCRLSDLYFMFANG